MCFDEISLSKQNTAHLICSFVFAYADHWFSDAVAQFYIANLFRQLVSSISNSSEINESKKMKVTRGGSMISGRGF